MRAANTLITRIQNLRVLSMVVDGTLPPACAGRGEIRPPSAEVLGLTAPP